MKSDLALDLLKKKDNRNKIKARMANVGHSNNISGISHF